ncbi:MAG: F0F1 ATP synthase subunit delta [Treponema sp.]|jgi:F-type H+-transporting ATPase subunit delta|nr:F0F1 ATP synthase subunit delta [Treponema sp.]
MFIPERWAQGFIGAARDDAALGLDLIKVLWAVIRPVRGHTAGTADAAQLTVMIHAAFAAAPPEGGDSERRSRELALGLVLLLVKKNLLRHTDRVIAAIEQELDTRQGVLRAQLESAQEAEGQFLADLRETLVKRTGAAGIRLDTRVKPELLAGCRLRIGGEIIDASLRTQLKQLGAELARAEGAPAQGGF